MTASRCTERTVGGAVADTPRGREGGPYSSERHVSEQLRCNGCGEIHRAELPPEVLADGASGQVYGYSAATRLEINGMDVTALRERLEQAVGEEDPRRRRMIALAVLTERLSADRITPILVGGGAVEFYTAGGYTTVDMDLALPACTEVDDAFAELGFDKVGRYWIREDIDLLFEAPAPAGLPGEEAPRTVVDVDGMKAHVIGVDDLIMDRLRAWVHWNSTEDERWTKRLAHLYKDRIDWQYLRSRAGEIPQEAAAIEELIDETG